MTSLKLSILLNQEKSQGVWESFLNYAPLPELMQGAGTAILTLLISFAIGIILHHMNDRNKAGGLLDLHVALDYVWMFKPSLAPLLIVVTLPFFMGVESTAVQSAILVVWLIGLSFLIWIVVRLYGWVKGDKHPPRLKYLANFPKNTNDKIVSWNDLWSTSQTHTRFAEKDYFIAFSNQVDALLKQETEKSWHIIAQLLTDFHTHIDKRDRVFLLVFDEFFPKILEWHYKVWSKYYSQYSKENIVNKDKLTYKAFESDLVIDQIIRYVTKEALVGPNGHAFSYFDTLKEHIEAHKDFVIDGTEQTYEYIRFIPIYEDCFEFIPQSPDSYNIWEHYFPSEWKINLSNLTTSPVARTWLNRYFDWAQSRIWKQSEEWDKQLDDLNKGLFDSVDPITWAKIHTFVFRPRKDNETKMETMVKHGTNFGYSGRTFSGWGDDFETKYRQLQEEEIENTINLALHIFSKVFTESNIKVWQSELAQLEHHEDSSEYRRVLVWKAVFNKMLEHIGR
jgi:hypothetical protein